ncbi:uncharacterized protein RBU33_017517 isoform 2-T3 [Hipposideros larvatus]
MSPAYKEAPGGPDWEPQKAQVPAQRGACHRLVMSAGVRAPRKALQSCLRAGRSPHLRDTEEQDRDARCPASSGSRAAFLFAGRRSPCSPQRRRLLLSFLSCHNQKRLLPPPTSSAPARSRLVSKVCPDHHTKGVALV